MSSGKITTPLRMMIQEWWSGSPHWIAVRAGVFLAISFPPIDLPFMLFLGWLDLQVLLFSTNPRIAQKCRLWVFLACLIWNALTTYWLMMATLGGGLAAIIANSGLMTLTLLVARAVVQTVEQSIGSQQGNRQQWHKQQGNRLARWIRPT
ncbi:MAG: hypothetical protein RI519_05240, partial [Balneolaceae bacterium]|nr:hypothetical protein [Balneolaceae bacterium]